MGLLIDAKEKLANQVSESTGTRIAQGAGSLVTPTRWINFIYFHLSQDLIPWERKSGWPNLGLGPTGQPGGIGTPWLVFPPSLPAVGEGLLVPGETEVLPPQGGLDYGKATRVLWHREPLGKRCYGGIITTWLNGETEALNESSLPEGSHVTTEMKRSDSCQPYGNFFLILSSLLKQWFRDLAVSQDYLWNLLKIEELGLAWGWCLCIFNKLLIWFCLQPTWRPTTPSLHRLQYRRGTL